MAKRPSARWAGTLQLPELRGLKLEVGFYGSTRRAVSRLPFLQVHTACSSPLNLAVTNDGERGKVAAEETEETVEACPQKAVQTTREVFCPQCNRALRAGELSSAVETPGLGLILVTDEERASLKTAPSKEAKLSLRRDPSPVLAQIGTGRRFYVLPKPQCVESYYLAMSVLEESECVGFIPALLIDKRSYVLIVRPIVTPAAIFGQSTRVLVADELMDTETLIDPREVQLLPAQEPAPSADVAALVLQAQLMRRPIQLAECISPERQNFDRLLQRKMTERKDTRVLG